MVKDFLVAVTPKLENYLKDNISSHENMVEVIKTAVKHADTSCFIAFHKQKGTTLVIDGDGNVLEKLFLSLPENIWVVLEETDAHTTCVAMLPREY
ncbi:hypothetical protein ACFOGI_15080 [Virgibacillus xinjiangensis]|uniref:Uncharacterized protein n=1 Tax=Virgibacillus xinjiangensis TaxID=393090 RepID=A0ABV7CZN6_9BACI